MSTKKKSTKEENSKAVEMVEETAKAGEKLAKNRELTEISGQRGSVLIMEKEGESVSGVTTLKEGRAIGEEEIPTIEILDLQSRSLKLLPATSVLRTKFEEACDKMHGAQFFAKITYLGKKNTRDGKRSYHDYSLAIGEATQDDLNILADFEAANM